MARKRGNDDTARLIGQQAGGVSDDYYEDEPLYDDTPLPALKRRRLWKKYRWLLWLLVMIPIVYFVVQLFIILAPRMRTEVAMLDIMTDSLPVTGQVVLESMPVSGGGGPLYYTVPAGQRVAPGAEVALVYASENSVVAMDRLVELESELELLTEAQRTVVDGGDLEILLGQLQAGLYNLLVDVENGNYDTLNGARGEIAAAYNKMQISTGDATSFESRINQLTAQKAQYEAMLDPIGAITAPEGGYFAPSATRDRKQMNYETVSALSPSQLAEALAKEPVYYGNDVVGHIITDYKWYFYTVVSIGEAERFVTGDKTLQLNFPDAGDVTIPVTVGEVLTDDENGIAKVELFSEYLSPEILTLRTEEAEVVFGEQKGIRIDKNALRLVDIENEDGSVSTYRGVYVHFGNMVYFRKIDIIVENEFYMLVPAEPVEDVSEVKLYDKVVVDSGGIELYDRKIL